MRIISAMRMSLDGEWEDGQPITEAVGRKLSRPLTKTRYEWERRGFLYRLVINPFFLFDGASIPWFAWSLIRLAPHGVMDGPSLPHDLIYHLRGLIQGPAAELYIYDQIKNDWVPCTVPIPRSESDALLQALCVHYNACVRRVAFEVWAAVRSFGWFAWWRDDEKRKDKQIDQLIKEAV